MFTEHPVIDFMPDQRDMEDKGGTMRLGLYPARLTPGSKAAAVYGQEVIYERHRHRFEVNNRYRQTLEAAGMLLSGQSPDGRLVEIVELRDHPWFVASQFHPEFKSRPERPHPLFDGFVTASLAVRDGREPVFAARRTSEPTCRAGAATARRHRGRHHLRPASLVVATRARAGHDRTAGDGVRPGHRQDRGDPHRQTLTVGDAHTRQISRTDVPAGARPMKIFLDTADIDEIRTAARWGVLDGVTTNPSLYAKVGGSYDEILAQVCKITPGPVSAEVIADDVDGHARGGPPLRQARPEHRGQGRRCARTASRRSAVSPTRASRPTAR